MIIKPNKLKCTVRGKCIFEGIPFETIIEDESTWTIEDQQLLRIQLVKMDERSKDTCWLSLLKDPIQFQPDPYILNDMRKKLDLERFQLEVHDIQFYTVFVYLITRSFYFIQNPGFDFSGAKLDKKYEDKGIKDMENAIKSPK